jgi:putative transposase
LSIKAAKIIEFLQHLRKHIKGQLLVDWNNLPADRSKVVAEYLAATQNRIWVDRLLSYEPEVNSIEYLWGCAKKQRVGQFLAQISMGD